MTLGKGHNTMVNIRFLKEQVDKLDSFKIKSFCSSTTLIKELKDKPQTEREQVESTYLIKNLYPQYIKNSQYKLSNNLTSKRAHM